MLRRALHIVRGITLAAFTGLTLLAGAAWVDVAVGSGGRSFGLKSWGGADGGRFVIGLGTQHYAPYERQIYSLEAGVVDRDAPETSERRSWVLADPIPSLHSVEFIPVLSGGHLPTYYSDRQHYCRYLNVSAPLGVLVLLFGLWPALAGVRFVGRRRRVNRRRELGLCLACGYDLRGLESARCPECGAAILTRKTAGG